MEAGVSFLCVHVCVCMCVIVCILKQYYESCIKDLLVLMSNFNK